jgi:hypothetical protein
VTASGLLLLPHRSRDHDLVDPDGEVIRRWIRAFSA